MTFYTYTHLPFLFLIYPCGAAGGLLSYIASIHFSRPHVSYIASPFFCYSRPAIAGYSIYIEPSAIDSINAVLRWLKLFLFFSISYIQRQYVGASLLDDRLFSFYFHSFRVFFYFLNAFDLPHIFGCWCSALSDVIYTCCWLPGFLFFTLWFAWSAGWLAAPASISSVVGAQIDLTVEVGKLLTALQHERSEIAHYIFTKGNRLVGRHTHTQRGVHL